MSLGGRFAAGAVLGMGEKFVGESLEIATGFRQEYSSAGDYLLMGALGGAGELVGAGINRIHQITEGTKTISAGLKALKREAVQEVGSWRQSITQRLRGEAASQIEERVGKGVANQADEVGSGLACPMRRLCFAAGTPVQTRDGQRNIEDLRVGDEVLSYNEQTGQTEYQPITALYAHQNALVLNITVEGEIEPLKVTPEHPFLAYRARNDLSSEDPDPDSQPNGEWIEAGHLKVGDQLRTATGTWAAITDIKAGGSVEWAYNFEVAENHSYFVGGRGVVVHNIKFYQRYVDCPPEGWQPDRQHLLKDKGKVPKEHWENVNRKILPEEIEDADPFYFIEKSTGKWVESSAHWGDAHSIGRIKSSEILNDWEHMFHGIYQSGRNVDIYWKDFSVVVTEAGKKHKVITAYGKAGGSQNPVSLKPWTNRKSWEEGEWYFSFRPNLQQRR